MIDAKTAKQRSDDLNNKNNEANLAIINSKIEDAITKSKYAVAIESKYVNDMIVSSLKELGYRVDRKNGFYDQRDPQGSVEPYYTIAWG